MPGYQKTLGHSCALISVGAIVTPAERIRRRTRPPRRTPRRNRRTIRENPPLSRPTSPPPLFPSPFSSPSPSDFLNYSPVYFPPVDNYSAPLFSPPPPSSSSEADFGGLFARHFELWPHAYSTDLPPSPLFPPPSPVPSVQFLDEIITVPDHSNLSSHQSIQIVEINSPRSISSLSTLYNDPLSPIPEAPTDGSDQD